MTKIDARGRLGLQNQRERERVISQISPEVSPFRPPVEALRILT